MLAVGSPPYVAWFGFWDGLAEAESLWARTITDEHKAAFQVAIESMIRTSVPPQRAAGLKELWSSMRLPARSALDHDTRWNLFCTLPRDPDSPDEEDAQELLKELTAGAAIDDGLRSQMVQFVKELKAAALVTLWRFTHSSFDYLATLPRDVLAELCTELFVLAMLEILWQVA